MQNARMDGAQAGNKILGRNINNLRYADDSTLRQKAKRIKEPLGEGEKWKCYLLSRVRLFVTLWTVAYQAPLSMGFSSQEYWSEKKKRILEWIAISFSMGSSQPSDRTQVSCITDSLYQMETPQGSPRGE